MKRQSVLIWAAAALAGVVLLGLVTVLSRQSVEGEEGLTSGMRAETQTATEGNTPPDVVKSLLEAIEDRDWKRACGHLSSEFLADNKQKIMSGTHFKRSGRKDRTSFYTSLSRVLSEWRAEKHGTVALVTLNRGGGSPDALMGVCEVRLVKEHGDWKVAEF